MLKRLDDVAKTNLNLRRLEGSTVGVLDLRRGLRRHMLDFIGALLDILALCPALRLGVEDVDNSGRNDCVCKKCISICKRESLTDAGWACSLAIEGPVELCPLTWVMKFIVLREHGDCLCLRCGTIFVEAFRQAVGILCICSIQFGRRTGGTTAAAAAAAAVPIGIHHTTIKAAQVWVTRFGVFHTASVVII